MNIVAIATYKAEGYVPGPCDEKMTDYELAVDYIESLRSDDFPMENLSVEVINSHLVKYTYPLVVTQIIPKAVLHLFELISSDCDNLTNYVYIDMA